MRDLDKKLRNGISVTSKESGIGKLVVFVAKSRGWSLIIVPFGRHNKLGLYQL